MSNVWKFSKTKSTARLVLLAIADHANHSGICWPSVRRIGQYCNTDRRAVQRAIKTLVDMGELERVEMGHGRSATKYKVNLRGGVNDTGGANDTSEAVDMTPQRRCKRHPNHNRTVIEPLYIIGQFNEFWTQYPKKVAKKTALKAYEKALKSASHEEIMTGLAKYKPDPKYICNPATWLNQGRWEDEPTSQDRYRKAFGSPGGQNSDTLVGQYQRAMARRKNLESV